MSVSFGPILTVGETKSVKVTVDVPLNNPQGAVDTLLKEVLELKGQLELERRAQAAYDAVMKGEEAPVFPTIEFIPKDESPGVTAQRFLRSNNFPGVWVEDESGFKFGPYVNPFKGESE